MRVLKETFAQLEMANILMTPAGPVAETSQGYRRNSESQWVSSNVPRIKKDACSNFIFLTIKGKEM